MPRIDPPASIKINDSVVRSIMINMGAVPLPDSPDRLSFSGLNSREHRRVRQIILFAWVPHWYLKDGVQEVWWGYERRSREEICNPTFMSFMMETIAQ